VWCGWAGVRVAGPSRRCGARWPSCRPPPESWRPCCSAAGADGRCYVLRRYVGRSRKGGMPASGLCTPHEPPLLILVSLADGPKHGHALAKDIEDFAGVRLGPGALYGAITRLAERGLIEAFGR